ncbi:uncharacterized protein Tco025E_02346 [Trypanosoma conorhini]|uniref:Uncharacterized protein n=1 Tax=Trypanosoma conorhini TaxID=83891 RepID=A0A422Q5T6_9TRYP|nr:uncharacterized protein Tco025E_02346 [Trypanosoma conorhini]RNF25323.1 hypothetical protein Tco025E_02346 [Trypanosoma conorhini]
MIGFFQTDSPTTRPQGAHGSPTSSLEDSRGGFDSDASSLASSAARPELVDTLQLEIQMRDERIKELEYAHEELRRTSQFTQGQLLEKLKKAEKDKTDALGRADKLQCGHQEALKVEKMAEEEQNKKNVNLAHCSRRK